jgi:hypothetical protein
VFLSSLLQIPFILSILGCEKKVGVITADSRSLDAALLAAMGINDISRIVVEGLETRKAFHRFAIEESGTLDPAEVEAETVDAGRKLVARDDMPSAPCCWSAACCRPTPRPCRRRFTCRFSIISR